MWKLFVVLYTQCTNACKKVFQLYFRSTSENIVASGIIIYWNFQVDVLQFIFYIVVVKQGRHLHDSVARICTTGVVPQRKLVVNWREVCVNLS